MLLSPEPPLLKVKAKAGGAIAVVTIVIIIATAYRSLSSNPLLTPKPAIIKATSPRGNMPIPIRELPCKLNPDSNAGIALPPTFPMIAKIVSTLPKTNTLPNPRTSTNIPITTKNTGTTKA